MRVHFAILIVGLAGVTSRSTSFSQFGDTAVVPSFRKLDPQIGHFKTLFRGRADDAHDALLVLGSTGPVSDSVWNKSDLLGLFLQDRGRPDRVYKLAVRRSDADGFTIEVARYRPGELTLARRPDYGVGARNLKFFFDVRSKILTHEAEYRPFSVSYVVYERGVPHFMAEDGKQFLAIRPNDDGFDVLRGPAGTRILARVPLHESWTEQERFRNVDRKRTEPVRFGPQSRFFVHMVENPSWGRVAMGIEERVSGRTRVYDLPQSACAEFEARRPKEYGLNRCPPEVQEVIGPCQVFEGRLWFAKSFYDSEGWGGVGAFGYFDPLERKYRLFWPPEIAGWSGSALLVEKDALWVGLTHRGEYRDSPGGLLRWDRATQNVRRYDVGSNIARIVRYRSRLYLATVEGIAILRDGELQKFIVDQTSSGSYAVLAQ